MTPERVALELIDGTIVEVDREAIEHVADLLAPGDGSRQEVWVNGRSVELIPLVSVAFGVDPSSFTLHEAMRAVDDMGFENDDGLVPRDVVVTSPWSPRDAYERDHQIILPARQLARLRGKWVGVRNRQVVVSSDDLSEVLAARDGDDLLVVFVPEKPADE